MLNSTKTWQENLKEGFYKEFGSFHAPCNLENTPKSETDDWEILNYCEQFITDLRKKDMEALIEYLKESDSNNIYSLIKDYYENN